MQRSMENLNDEDRRTYRRWVRGVFLFYSVATIVALGITFTNVRSSDQRASNEIQIARLKATTESGAVSTNVGLASRP